MDERRSAEPKPLGLVQPIFLSPPSTFFLLLLLVLILNHSPRPRRGHMSRLVISISRKTRLKTTEIEMTKKWKKSFFSLLLLICFWLRLYLLPASYEVTSWRRDVFLNLFQTSLKVVSLIPKELIPKETTTTIWLFFMTISWKQFNEKFFWKNLKRDERKRKTRSRIPVVNKWRNSKEAVAIVRDIPRTGDRLNPCFVSHESMLFPRFNLEYISLRT